MAKTVIKEARDISADIVASILRNDNFTLEEAGRAILEYRTQQYIRQNDKFRTDKIKDIGLETAEYKDILKKISKAKTHSEIANQFVRLYKEDILVRYSKNLSLNEIYADVFSEELFGDLLTANEEEGILSNISDQIESGIESATSFFQNNIVKTLGRLLGGYALNTLFRIPTLYGSGPPDCTIGIIPLYHAEEIEVAHSGRILKFRATGSIFLAHQMGGKDAIRVEGYFYKEGIFVKLLGLWLMFMAMSGQETPIEEDESDSAYYGENFDDWTDLRDKLSTVKSYRSDVVKPSYQRFRTVPFVSEHVIIPNVYIETFSFEDRVVDGRDVLKYSILMRTYEEPQDIKIYEYQEQENPTDLTFTAPQHDYSNNITLIAGFITNMTRRLIKAYPKYIDMKSYRDSIRYNQENYYDIDVVDLSTTFAMSAIAKLNTSSVLGGFI